MQRICRPLLSWYGENRRDLEWRRDPLPYYVWVSEIMLQQTRVEAVKPYFHRFVMELPDIRSLAQCQEDRLLKLWEGLGYYSRARNLRKAAQMILEQHGGEMPSDEKTLKSLPGIGSYTAGAIASIAFSLPSPAVDGNVLRVISRTAALECCVDEPGVKAEVEDLIRSFLERERETVLPGDFNQALMELGAVVCLPNGDPVCGGCPVRELCAAKEKGLTGSIPVRKKKKARRIEQKTILVIRDTSRALIRKRPHSGLLAGMWELPNADGHLTQDQVLSLAGKIGVSAVRIRPLPSAKHVFTHVEWHMTGYLVLVEEMEETGYGLLQSEADEEERAEQAGRSQLPGEPGEAGENIEDRFEYLPVEIKRIEKEYSIPTAFARYAAYLDIRRTGDDSSVTIGNS